MNPAILDTDILSFFLKGDQEVTEKVSEYLVHHDRLTITSITEFEILAGLHYKDANAQITKFHEFVAGCRIVNLSSDSVQRSAEIYGELRKKGIKIGSPDLLIAGIAIENDLELITNNSKHYSSIPNLKLDNWKK